MLEGTFLNQLSIFQLHGFNMGYTVGVIMVASKVPVMIWHGSLCFVKLLVFSDCSAPKDYIIMITFTKVAVNLQ